MQDRILLVDDDKNLLDSLKRQLRKHFDVKVALGPKEGLIAVTQDGPFAVIVSDLRMPIMDGIQFLANVSKLEPDSVRIMLTGNADLNNAIEAVNHGNIYRFLTKPCAIDTFVQVLNQGVRQYRLVQSEKELLEQTLRGSIQMLTDLLSMLNPDVFGRASIIKNYAHDVAVSMGASELWKIDTAAMLSQIGCLTLPEPLLEKIFSGTDPNDAEMRRYEAHPAITAELLSHIPRIEAITDAIRYQSKHFDGSGVPEDAVKGKELPLGARILKVVTDFDLLESRGASKSESLLILEKRVGCYDPAVVEALEAVLGVQAESKIREVSLADLSAGMLFTEDVLVARMIFTEDVRAANGRTLVTRGQQVSPVIIKRLINFTENMEIVEPLRVRMGDRN